MPKRVALAMAAVCLLAGILGSRADAEQPSAAGEIDTHQLVRRLEAQDQRIRELESRLNQPEPPIRVSPAVMDTNSNVMQRIEALESSYPISAHDRLLDGDEREDTHGEKWTHKWGGRIMGDYVNWLDQDPRVGGQDAFEFRRLRLFVSGNGYGVYDYKFQVDFEPENGFDVLTPDEPVDGEIIFTDGVAMKDMYVGIHDLPRLGYVRFGHFKTPFSLEEQTSSKYITFMERSVINVFSPMREVGVTAFNNSANERFTWAYGAFFDDISEVRKQRIDDNQGMRAVARATWTPYYDEPADGRYLVHTGVSFAYTDDQDGKVAFSSRPEHEGPSLVTSGVVDANHYNVLNTEFAVVNGPFSLQSELVWTNIAADVGPNLNYYGAYAYASYFLTGEHRPYNRKYARFERVKPLENFWIVNTPDGRCTGKGAWELAARWGWIDLTDGPDEEQLHNLTVGVNWYWNPHSRMMVNWIHPFTNGPSGNGHADLLGMRLQVDF